MKIQFEISFSDGECWNPNNSTFVERVVARMTLEQAERFIIRAEAVINSIRRKLDEDSDRDSSVATDDPA